MKSDTVSPAGQGAPNQPKGDQTVTTTTTNSTVFVCRECGASRTSAARGADARLRCDACGSATQHRLAGARSADGHLEQSPRHSDWREQINERESAKLRTLLWLESVYASFRVAVTYGKVGDYQGGGRTLFETAHKQQDGGHCWGIRITEDASLAGRIHALRNGLSAMLSENLDYSDTSEYSSWRHRSQQPWEDFIPE